MSNIFLQAYLARNQGDSLIDGFKFYPRITLTELLVAIRNPTGRNFLFVAGFLSINCSSLSCTWSQEISPRLINDTILSYLIYKCTLCTVREAVEWPGHFNNECEHFPSLKTGIPFTRS